MIRPCDDCGGSGGVESTYKPAHPIHGPSEIEPCPACIDMPWLDWREFSSWWVWNNWTWDRSLLPDGPEWYSNHEPRKPDRSTVTRWCDVHEAVGTGKICQAWDLASRRIGRNLFDRIICRIVLIEKPTALKEAT